jgi:hypothetical protein
MVKAGEGSPNPCPLEIENNITVFFIFAGQRIQKLSAHFTISPGRSSTARRISDDSARGEHQRCSVAA